MKTFYKRLIDIYDLIEIMSFYFSSIFYLLFFRNENLSISVRIESLSISIDILNDLFNSVVPDDDIDSDIEATGDLEQKNGSYEVTHDPLLSIHNASPLSDENKTSLELIVLLKLLVKLAYMQIKNGENPNYTFASILPKLFYRTDTPQIIPANLPLSFFPNVVAKKSVVPWSVDKRQLSCDILELCISCYVTRKLRSNAVFKICGVMLPKLVKNLDRTGLVEPLKFQLLQGKNICIWFLGISSN